MQNMPVTMVRVKFQVGVRGLALFIYLFYWSVEHELHVHKSTSSTTRLHNTYSCLLKHKNIKQSTER